MAINKVLLYYCFTPLKDPEAIRLWQLNLCETLGIKGRILISEHGMNGTVGGDIKALKKYVKATKKYEGFARTDFKWSDGTGNDFPKLKVKVRKELVTFLADHELEVDETGVVGGGVHLQPEDVHALVEQRGDDVVFFDGRNAFEAKIGRFKNAIIPNTDTTRDFVDELDSGKYDHLKDKPIVTYCTGGIRCEVLSALMKKRGFEEVYQIQGGIVRYGETYKDKGLWEGSLYTFDARMTIDFSPDTEVIGQCDWCKSPTKRFYNCHDDFCIQLLLLCESCATQSETIECRHPHPHGDIDFEIAG